MGIAWAARRTHIPVAISFTVETDGRLPTGQSLKTAITAVDEATDAYPVYYMINCAHPSHFEGELAVVLVSAADAHLALDVGPLRVELVVLRALGVAA